MQFDTDPLEARQYAGLSEAPNLLAARWSNPPATVVLRPDAAVTAPQETPYDSIGK